MLSRVCAAGTARPGTMAHAPLGHADAMQIILFCMAYFLAVKLFRYWTSGAPGEIRTPDPQIRSLVLCPAELRARRVLAIGFAAYWQAPAAVAGRRDLRRAGAVGVCSATRRSGRRRKHFS